MAEAGSKVQKCDGERLKQLNQYQMEAVLDESPACLVNANVGSGKTTVLIAKILYLHLECGVPLEEMVVLTFTNKAADEIIQRLLNQEPGLTKEQVRGFGTFHSVAVRILKEYLPEGNSTPEIEKSVTGQMMDGRGGDGWTRDFTVMDPEEETDLAMDLIAAHQLKVKYKNRLKKRLEQEYNHYLQGRETGRYGDDLFLLYPLLEEEKKRQNKMSFSDLLRVSSSLLREEKKHPRWIIVDEVQDSDALQMDFLEALKGDGTKLFAVGDPNQVIYSWRGTTQNMFYLLKHRFEARELSLPVNYRSNASILEAANRFLQFGTKIQGCREAECKIAVKNHYDPFQEAEYLAERIRTLHETGSAYGDIAVFYRLQKQSEILEKVFEKNQIPYEVSVKKTIREIPVLNWMIKVLRFSVNHADEQTGIQVLADPQYGERCTKKKAADVVKNRKTEANLLYKRMMEFGDFLEDAKSVFAYFGLKEALHPTALSYAEDEKMVMEFLDRLCGFCRDGNYGMVEGTREFINSSVLYGVNVCGNYEAGKSAAQGDAPGENAAGNGTAGQRDTVKLMTLHASKGLEFNTVFLTGVNQGLIPLHTRNFDQEEEERRLFFVGITRAKNELELSYYTNPGEPGVLGEPSRYLHMIPEHLLEWEELRTDTQKRTNLQNLRKQVKEQIREKAAEQEIETPSVRHARHAKYGVGVVISEDDMMVEVEFDGYGRKQFLKAFGEVEML